MKKMNLLIAFFLMFGMVFSAAAPKAVSAEPLVNFSILHTNDFHGNLQLAGSNPGAADTLASGDGCPHSHSWSWPWLVPSGRNVCRSAAPHAGARPIGAQCS